MVECLTSDVQSICPYCKVQFIQSRPDQVYYSDKHRRLAHNAKSRANGQGKWNDYQKRYREELRDKVFEMLGNKCVHCSESDPIVLSIDHKQAVGKSRDKLTVPIYLEILRNPEEGKKKYQLLCRNCNWRKMILNNERQLRVLEFAYHWELDALQFRIEKLESNLNKKHSEKIGTPPSILSDLETVTLLKTHREKITDMKGRVNCTLIRAFLAEELHITIGYNRSNTIKTLLERDENGQIQKGR